MKVLVIQSCECDRFLEALNVVRSRWPQASITALIDEAFVSETSLWLDRHEILVYGRGHRARPTITAETRRCIRARRFDLCVLSYNERSGVRFWNFRMLPILTGISRVVAINDQRTISTYRRFSWCVATVWGCTALRLIQFRIRVPRSTRNALEAGLDHAMITLLTLLAVVGAGLKTLGLHPLMRRRLGRRSVSPRLFIFIPDLCAGGAQKALVNFLRRLDLRKYRVEVCTLEGTDRFFEPEVRGLGVLLTYLPCGGGIPYWKIIWALTRRLSRESPDVAIGWLPSATVFTAIAASLTGVPRIIMSLRSQSPDRIQTQRPPWQRPLDVITARLVDKVIACSNACRDDYIAWGRIPPGKIVTVYNGVEESEVQQLEAAEIQKIRSSLGADGRPVVGIVGRLSPEKDHHTFFEALRAVRHAVPTLKGIVVGDGNERSKLIEDAKRLDLADCVDFLGVRKDALAVIASLDVLALTSRTEGLPNVLLEAQALGVPVVTTDAGGAPEVVRDGETGYVVPCGDSERLASCLVKLLTDEPLRRRFGQKARAHVLAMFRSDRMAAEILQHCQL